MTKRHMYTALAMALIAGKSIAQETHNCATDEMHARYTNANPTVAKKEQELNNSIEYFLAAKKENHLLAARGTADEGRSDTDYYDIPVVVHVIHNHGAENVKDSNIYAMIASLNKFYNKQNDLSGIIAPFRTYIGNAKIRFHLATVDPYGMPTTGITRRFSYLTNGGDDQAKMDQWPPRSYYNIWIENRIGMTPAAGITLAYSTFPSSAEVFPYTDGVITGYNYINDGNTMEHETGHYLNLSHTWATSGAGVGAACGDDMVDDTPPTKGHFSTCDLWDTSCAVNNYKLYISASGSADSLVNYPDTTNTQNVMDYSSCPHNMLTTGQVWRMRATLNSNIGGRNNLWDTANLRMTGALAPRPDLPPVPDYFSRVAASTAIAKFTFPGVPLFFVNKSWRDTIVSSLWSFSNNASTPTVSQTSPASYNTAFPVSFSNPGWVTLSLAVEGNNSGVATTAYNNAIFVADNEGINPLSSPYIEEFDNDGKKDKWPFFNYYNNEFRWQLANVGMYDNSSMMYRGYDARTIPANFTGTPFGDYDDLFSTVYDLSAFPPGKCNLFFNYAGASRSSLTTEINDSLYIEYSVNKTHTWMPLAAIGKAELCNNGAIASEFIPTSASQWATRSIAIPEAARKAYVVFRFRYKPGVNAASLRSTGNNFYLDRVFISPWAVNVNDVAMNDITIKVLPNPTNGDAWVIVKDAFSNAVSVTVTDIAGRVVYRVSEVLPGNIGQIRIPSEAIANSGMYLVHTISGSQVSTQKLIVNR